MVAKKIAFTAEVGVKAAAVKQLVADAESYLYDVHDLQVKLGDNPAVLALIEKNVKKVLGFMADDLYFDDVVDPTALEKLFKKEIKEARDKYEQQARAEEEAAIARRAATAGVLRMHPDKLAEAKKLLKAAGIEATT